MLGERIELPTKKGLTPILVLQVTDIDALVEASTTGSRFSLPLVLLPGDVKVGDRLSIKLFSPEEEEQTHTEFAQRLLEDIIN